MCKKIQIKSTCPLADLNPFFICSVYICIHWDKFNMSANNTSCWNSEMLFSHGELHEQQGVRMERAVTQMHELGKTAGGLFWVRCCDKRRSEDKQSIPHFSLTFPITAIFPAHFSVGIEALYVFVMPLVSQPQENFPLSSPDATCLALMLVWVSEKHARQSAMSEWLSIQIQQDTRYVVGVSCQGSFTGRASGSNLKVVGHYTIPVWSFQPLPSFVNGQVQYGAETGKGERVK